jgi:hypothetical protein
VDRLPSQQEHRELAELTRVCLEECMFARYPEASPTTLDDFITSVNTTSFTAGEPISLYNPSLILYLPKISLDSLITRAFTGVAYLALLPALPSQNIFSSTSVAAIVRDLPG